MIYIISTEILSFTSDCLVNYEWNYGTFFYRRKLVFFCLLNICVSPGAHSVHAHFFLLSIEKKINSGWMKKKILYTLMLKSGSSNVFYSFALNFSTCLCCSKPVRQLSKLFHWNTPKLMKFVESIHIFLVYFCCCAIFVDDADGFWCFLRFGNYTRASSHVRTAERASHIACEVQFNALFTISSNER